MYNKEGITKWKDILERLRSETPPIHITYVMISHFSPYDQLAHAALLDGQHSESI
jgi:hypothetical protein